MTQKHKEYLLTPAQLRKLHGLRRALGLDEETYRQRLAGVGVVSSKELTMRQADAIIAGWEDTAIKQGAWKRRGKQEHADLDNRRGDLATPAQLRFLQGLWKDVSRVVDDKSREIALNRLCRRIVKRDNIRFVTKVDASKLIKTLESMKQAEEAKAPCPA